MLGENEHESIFIILNRDNELGLFLFHSLSHYEKLLFINNNTKKIIVI